MTLVERVRAALEGWGNVREVEMFGGLVFDWDGDPLVGVVDDELIVRVEGGGWSTVTGDVAEWVERSSKVVLAEAVVHWRGHLHTGGIDAMAFTGGIGENSDAVRRAIIHHLSWINTFPVHIVLANEENVIAQHVKRLIT